ncbi:MAG TPA: MFS transporter [Chloroflexia bacterium]|nr:MFS transporter [Chloroflexia bacterium]
MYPKSTQSNNLRSRLTSAIRTNPLVRYPDLGLMCLGIFVMFVGIGAVIPIRTIYAREHGADMNEIGWMASAFILGLFISQIPGGWASDKWGRKPLVVTGVAVAGVMCAMMLLNDHPWYFITLRFIEGLASGAIGPAANAYVLDTVPAKERGAAYGWLGSAFSAGFMMGPAIGGIMVDWLGYASPFIYGSVTTLATALFLGLKMTNRKPGAKSAESEAEAAPEEGKVKRHIPRNLFAPAFVAALAFTVAGGFADGLFMSIWSIWLNDLHASNSFIGFTFVTFSLPVVVLMPITGKMADKYRLAPLIALPSILISFAYLTYGFTTDLLFIAIWGLLEGALVAVYGPALSAYIANLSPDNARGRLQGVVSTSRTVAGFVSSMLVAFLYGINTTFPFFMLAGVQLFIGVAGGLLIWQIERRSSRVDIIPSTIPTLERKGGAALESAAK